MHGFRGTAVTVVALVLPLAVVPSTRADEPLPPPDRAVLQELLEGAVGLGYPGVLARVEDEAGTWTSTAGVADVKTDQKVREDSRWRVASVTKPLVATAVLQLVADGQLGLDDSVEDVHPGLLTGAKADQITIRHLLSMRSGLFQYLDDPSILGPHNPLGLGYEYFAPGVGELLHDWCRATYDARELIALSDARSPYFTPGSEFNYANINYIVLGQIIEHLTGKTYQQAIHDQILGPLGMDETTFVETGPLPQPHPRGYTVWFYWDPTRKSYPRLDVTDCNTSVFGAAGSAVADADDLATFTDALLGGELLPADLTDQMLATNEVAPGFGYGLGLVRLGLPCGVDVVGHDGAVLGFVTEHFASEDGTRTMTIMGNEYVEPPGAFGAIYQLLVAEFCGAP